MKKKRVIYLDIPRSDIEKRIADFNSQTPNEYGLIVEYNSAIHGSDMLILLDDDVIHRFKYEPKDGVQRVEFFVEGSED